MAVTTKGNGFKFLLSPQGSVRHAAFGPQCLAISTGRRLSETPVPLYGVPERQLIGNTATLLKHYQKDGSMLHAHTRTHIACVLSSIWYHLALKLMYESRDMQLVRLRHPALHYVVKY